MSKRSRLQERSIWVVMEEAVEKMEIGRRVLEGCDGKAYRRVWVLWWQMGHPALTDLYSECDYVLDDDV